MAMRQARFERGLGWFSLGLGAACFAAPRAVAQLAGLHDSRSSRDVLRAIALREVACGIGILAGNRPDLWLWARVGGDAIDLALLAAATSGDHATRGRTAAAMAAVAGIAALDAYCALSSHRGAGDEILFRHSITINRPPEDVYAFWRELPNLPRFLSHLERVQVTGSRTSHWRAKGPGGLRVEWQAEITDDRPNQMLAWRALEGADIPNHGRVGFTPGPGGRGTVVRVDLAYRPPGGRPAATLAKLFGGEPEQVIRADLRQLKQVLETGEVARSDASIHPGLHPAQPPRQWRIAP